MVMVIEVIEVELIIRLFRAVHQGQVTAVIVDLITMVIINVSILLLKELVQQHVCVAVLYPIML